MNENWKKENLEKVIEVSKSVRECLEKMGYPNYGDRYTYFKNKIKKYNIDISHFSKSSQLRSNNIQNAKNLKPKYSLEEIFCKNSKHSMPGDGLKRHLFKLGWNLNKCSICELENDKWVSGKISMILDHIDGDHKNDELSNLRIICPNCDSTLPTYKSRNIKKNKNSPIV